jgi:hypothetical protein
LSLTEKTVSLTIAMPESLYDQLAAEAIRRRIDLAPLVRCLLSLKLKTSSGGASLLP